MGWDYSFFIPRNNLFRKEGLIHEQEEISTLLVTEVNRCIPCSMCGKSVGDVSNTFYEISEKHYCSLCGFKLTSNAPGREISKTGRKGQIMQRMV